MRRLSVSVAIFISVLSSIGSLLVSQKTEAAVASDFRAGNLIDDSKFTDKNSMSVATIQAFLESKNTSCQAGYTCLKSYSENGKGSAQIIWENSQQFSINPQVILVLLEKEQGLVTRSDPGAYEYRFATGYCVYDSSPPPQCADTDGFTRQIYYAAKMFRGIMDGTRFSSFIVGNNTVLYNPNTSCGSSNVFIENRATTALYTYTPYQPNGGSIAYRLNGGRYYNTAYPDCGAYGNLNFWIYFTNWFGPTTGEGYVLVTSYNNNGDPRQWVMYRGIKRHVYDEVMLQAWGLDKVPLIQMTGLQLGAVPIDAPLGRLFRPSGTLDVYFVDGGKCYRVTSPDMMSAWNFSPGAIQDIGVDLGRVPTNSGNLTYSITNASNTAVHYYVDGGSLRRYADQSIQDAWEGSNKFKQTISSNYLSLMGTAPNITTKSARYGSNYFLFSNGQPFLTTDQNVADVWGVKIAPGMNRNISPEFSQYFMMTRFARSAYPNDSRLFVVENGTLYHLSPEHANNLGAFAGMPVMAVIPENITPNIAPWSWVVLSDSSGKQYVVDGGTKRYFPNSGTQNFWTSNGSVNVPMISNGFLNLLPTSGIMERGIRGSGPRTYSVEGVTKRWIQNPATVPAYAPILQVSDSLINVLPNGPVL